MRVEQGRQRRWRTAIRGVLVALVLATSLAVAGPPVAAHSPHDDIFDVAVSPQFGVDHTLFTVSRGLLLRSTDGGTSWQRLVRGLDNLDQFYGVSFAGGSASHAYAVSGDGVFRSDDGGSSWLRVYTTLARDLRLVATSPSAPGSAIVVGATTGALITSTSGASWQPLGASAATITAAAYAPASSQAILAGDASGALHVTGDGGQTWSDRPFASAGSITSITPSPSYATDGLAFIGTGSGGVLRWDAGTQTATPVNTGLTDLRVTSMAFSAGYPADRTVFASTWSTGPFVSTDGGSTWQGAAIGLEKDPQPDTPTYADRPHFGKLATAVLDPAGQQPVVLLGSFTGVYSSTDQAASWQGIETLTSGIVVGLALSPTFGTDRKLAITTYLNGAFTSSDAGSSWQASNLSLAEPSLWNERPDSFVRSYAVAISPTVGGQSWMYTANFLGVYRSSNGGLSWQLTPVPGFRNPRTDTTTPGTPRVWVSPTFATDHTVLLDDVTNGEIYRSTDEGASFTKVGQIPLRNHCLEAAPTFAVDHRLLACTGSGVYVSTDLGATWTATKKLVMSDLAVTVGPGSLETWFAATTSGLYRSTDRGAQWALVALPGLSSASSQILAVAASPPASGAATVLVSVKGKGLFRSTDGGTVFTSVGTALLAANEQFDTYIRQTAKPIVFSPSFATDRTVFGSSHDHLFRSTDGGATWDRLTVPTALHGAAFPVTPGAPTIETPTRGYRTISVAFTAPADGGAPILQYDATCTSSNGGVTRSAAGAGSPIVVSSLSNGKTYTCTVSATNARGTGPLSAASSAVVPATTPSAPSVLPPVAGHQEATVSWAAPTSSGGSAITGYVVTPFIGFFPLPSVTFASPARTQTITGLTDGITYRFRVAAINAVGTGPTSPSSDPVTPGIVAPGAPTIVGAAGLAGSAALSWAAPASNGGSAITGYVVTPYVGYFPLPSITFASAAVNQTITGLTDGVTYRFRVAAINAVGTGAPSATSAGVVPGSLLPGTPTLVSATGLAGSATLSWAAPVPNAGPAVTGYVVTPYIGFFPLSPITFTSAAVNQTIAGLTPGVTYRFKVAAVNAIGTGPTSKTSNPATPT